ncbi:DUF4352 domain-containing protein [Geitlerinema sp. CS-897]|nr:DUF4352 domain-containing protein [Geitlerinema sp. CS-897]
MFALYKLIVRGSVVTALLLLTVGCGSNGENAPDEGVSPPRDAVESPDDTAGDTVEEVAEEAAVTTGETASEAIADSAPPDIDSGTVYALNTPIEYRDTLGIDGVVSITGMREFTGEGMFEQPADGTTWLAVMVEIENNGDRDYIVTFQEMQLVDAEGNYYRQDLQAASVLDTDLEPVAVGDRKAGEIAFEVPETAEIEKLVYDPSNGACDEEGSILAESYPCESLPIVVELK